MSSLKHHFSQVSLVIVAAHFCAVLYSLHSVRCGDKKYCFNDMETDLKYFGMLQLMGEDKERKGKVCSNLSKKRFETSQQEIQLYAEQFCACELQSLILAAGKGNKANVQVRQPSFHSIKLQNWLWRMLQSDGFVVLSAHNFWLNVCNENCSLNRSREPNISGMIPRFGTVTNIEIHENVCRSLSVLLWCSSGVRVTF